MAPPLSGSPERSDGPPGPGTFASRQCQRTTADSKQAEELSSEQEATRCGHAARRQA